jgi:glutamyl-tRNA synthetase
MHLGVARTSLAAWLDARKNGGRILLRIEDLDTPRIVPGATEGLMEDLRWLGLDWDGDPVFQSQRLDLYIDALGTLDRLGRTYPCTCSRKELLERLASAPHGPSDEGPRYPGTCRAGAGRSDRAPSIRLRTEQKIDRIEQRDLLYGPIDQDVFAEVGDFVIRRADGVFAYQLAVTVDDLLQGVNRVVRGADLLGSTPRQLLIRRLIDPRARPLETLHVPLIRDPTGKRLAKRDGSAGIASRRARGEAPGHVLGLLASSLGLVPEGTECSLNELISLWGPEHVYKDDFVFPDRV